jgi:hypothetical protein
MILKACRIVKSSGTVPPFCLRPQQTRPVAPRIASATRSSGEGAELATGRRLTRARRTGRGGRTRPGGFHRRRRPRPAGLPGGWLARDRSARLWSEAPRFRVVQTRKTGLGGILRLDRAACQAMLSSLRKLFPMQHTHLICRDLSVSRILCQARQICVRNTTGRTRPGI